MKKILWLICLLIVSFSSFAQFPNKTGTNNQYTRDSTLGGRKGHLITYWFVDTSAANLHPYIKNEPDVIIRTGGDLTWQRSHDAKRWVLLNGNGVTPCPDYLIGSATWTGSGLDYDVSILNYNLPTNPCVAYTTRPTLVTMQAAHSTLDRKDIIVCDINSLVYPIAGVPGSGIPPAIDPFTQRIVAVVDIHAGWLTPYGQSVTTIYDENIEWASVSDVLIIDFASAIPAPYTGTVSTKVTTAADGTYIQWIRPTGAADISNGQYLKFRVKLSGSPTGVRPFLTVTFYNNATQSTNSFTVSNGQYGMDYSSTDWQLIVIPIISPFYSTTADRVKFVINGASGINFQLDKVYLLEGSNPPPILTGIDWLVGGNNLTGIRPAWLGSTTKDPFSLVTEGRVRLIFSEDGIEENNTNDVWMLMRRESDGMVYKRKLDSASGLGCIKIIDSIGIKWVKDTCSGGGASQTFPEVLATGRTFTDKDSVLLGDKSFNFKNGDVKVQERHFIGDTATSDKRFIWYGNSVTIFIPLQKHIHHRFPYIVSTTFNATEDNRGISGTRLVAATGSDSSMENRIYTIGTYTAGDYIFFDYGINDRTAGTDTTTFKTKYLKIIDSCIAKGYPLDHITVLTPTYLSGLDSFRIACITAANARGVNYVDLYTYMANSGIATDRVLLPDGVHPTVYGHKIYAEAIVQNLTALPKIGVLDVEGYANITKGLNVGDYVDIHGGITVEGDSTFDEEKIILYKKTHASGTTKIGLGIHEADTTLRIVSTKGISFGQWSYDGTFSSKMDVFSNGRVGIGSADLGWTLSVGGNACARFTGIVQVDDRMIIGGSSGATNISGGLNVLTGTTSIQGLTVAGDNGVADSRWKIYKNSNSINSLGVSASGEFLFNAGPNNFVWNYLSTSDGTTLTPLMTLNKTTGKLRLHNYGVGTFTGTATKSLQVDANGYLIEGDVSASGSDTVLTGNTAYVDAVNGNDGTAVLGSFNKPYLTLGAAVTAATSGYTIVVRPGTYSNAAQLLKDGVDWYFMPNTIVSQTNATGQAMFDDAGGNDAVCKITGYGNFVDTLGGEGCVLKLADAATNVYFEAQDISVGNGNTDVGISIEGATVTINIKGTVWSSSYDAVIVSSGTLNLVADKLLSTSATEGNAIEVAGGTSNIKCREYRTTGDFDAFGSSAGIYWSGGNSTIEGDGVAELADGLVIGSATAGVITLRGKLTATSKTSVTFLSATSNKSLVNQATLVSAATYSIDAPSAQTVASFGSFANKIVNANVTVNGILTVGTYVQ